MAVGFVRKPAWITHLIRLVLSAILVSGFIVYDFSFEDAQLAFSSTQLASNDPCNDGKDLKKIFF